MKQTSKDQTLLTVVSSEQDLVCWCYRPPPALFSRGNHETSVWKGFALYSTQRLSLRLVKTRLWWLLMYTPRDAHAFVFAWFKLDLNHFGRKIKSNLLRLDTSVECQVKSRVLLWEWRVLARITLWLCAVFISWRLFHFTKPEAAHSSSPLSIGVWDDFCVKIADHSEDVLDSVTVLLSSTYS